MNNGRYPDFCSILLLLLGIDFHIFASALLAQCAIKLLMSCLVFFYCRSISLKREQLELRTFSYGYLLWSTIEGFANNV